MKKTLLIITILTSLSFSNDERISSFNQLKEGVIKQFLAEKEHTLKIQNCIITSETYKYLTICMNIKYHGDMPEYNLIKSSIEKDINKFNSILLISENCIKDATTSDKIKSCQIKTKEDISEKIIPYIDLFKKRNK